MTDAADTILAPTNPKSAAAHVVYHLQQATRLAVLVESYVYDGDRHRAQAYLELLANEIVMVVNDQAALIRLAKEWREREVA
jgi:hypothetical protein